MTSQMEMRNMLLETGEAKNMTDFCLCPSVLCKRELVSDDIGYLAENISKKSVEGAGFSLLFIIVKFKKKEMRKKVKRRK